jgi:hypothetical protein
MSEIPFHQTRMGHAFYEGTMPRLVRELARLNENLERLNEQREAKPAERPDGEGEEE